MRDPLTEDEQHFHICEQLQLTTLEAPTACVALMVTEISISVHLDTDAKTRPEMLIGAKLHRLVVLISRLPRQGLSMYICNLDSQQVKIQTRVSSLAT